MTAENGWKEWQNHILKELERLSTAIGEIQKDIQNVSISVAKLQVKAGAWGALGGAIAASIPMGMLIIRNLA